MTDNNNNKVFAKLFWGDSYGTIRDSLSKVIIINPFHAAGVSRRQQKLSQNVQKVKILEFGDYSGNHHKKCIQISTNMPGIGFEIC